MIPAFGRFMNLLHHILPRLEHHHAGLELGHQRARLDRARGLGLRAVFGGGQHQGVFHGGAIGQRWEAQRFEGANHASDEFEISDVGRDGTRERDGALRVDIEAN